MEVVGGCIVKCLETLVKLGQRVDAFLGSGHFLNNFLYYASSVLIEAAQQFCHAPCHVLLSCVIGSRCDYHRPIVLKFDVPGERVLYLIVISAFCVCRLFLRMIVNCNRIYHVFL